MKGIEAAIRKALSKPGMADPQQRQRVYESARKALANGIDQQGLGGTDRAARQAELLEGLIGRIEDTFWAEPPPPDLGFDAEAGDDDPDGPDDLVSGDHEAPPADEFDVPPPPREQASLDRLDERPDPGFDDGPHAQTGRADPAFSDIPAPERYGEPAAPDPDGAWEVESGRLDSIDIGAPEPVAGGRAPRRPHAAARADQAAAIDAPRAGSKKRRRPIFAMILVTCLVIAFVGIGAVWVMVSGALQTPQQRDTSVPNPPATIDSEDFAGLPSPDGAFSGDWIDVFTPRDAATVSGGEAAELDLLEDGGRDALRVVSRDAGAPGEVLFELGPGLLQSLAGGQSMVALTMRSSGDVPTQIYVRCVLPGGGDCGRHRFDVTYEAGDVIFSFDLSNAGAATEPAFLALNSDITGAGNGVDIYGIRIRPQ